MGTRRAGDDNNDALSPHAPRSTFCTTPATTAMAQVQALARLGALRARAPLLSPCTAVMMTPRPASLRGRRVRALSVAAAGQAKMCEPGQTLPDATLIEKHKPVRIHDIFKGSIFAL
jgi:hypothetical protein